MMNTNFFLTIFFLCLKWLSFGQEVIIIEEGEHTDCDWGLTEYVVHEPDVDPEFTGGIEALYQYIRDSLTYPEKVEPHYNVIYLGFIIEVDGRVSDPKILKNAGQYPVMEELLMELVKQMPRWKPGLVDGKAVRTSFVLPFRIETG